MIVLFKQKIIFYSFSPPDTIQLTNSVVQGELDKDY